MLPVGVFLSPLTGYGATENEMTLSKKPIQNGVQSNQTKNMHKLDSTEEDKRDRTVRTGEELPCK